MRSFMKENGRVSCMPVLVASEKDGTLQVAQELDITRTAIIITI